MPVNVGVGESLRASRGRRFTICTMLAERLNNLGTETAFAVSLAAAEWAAKGNRVYPFHLGDINLPTPANVVEAMNRAIADGKTGYCAGRRHRPAARGAGRRRRRRAAALHYGPRQRRGAAGWQAGDRQVPAGRDEPRRRRAVPDPGYPIYESQIEYFGGTAQPYRYIQTAHRVRDRPRPSAQPDHAGHQGADLQQPAEPARLRELARRDGRRSPTSPSQHDLWVLSDEAYFEMRYSGTSTSIASLPGMASAP